MIRTGSAATLLGALMIVASAPVAAHDKACIEDLWTLPVESLALPAGWTIGYIEAQPLGQWNLTLFGPGGIGVDAQLGCVQDLAGFAAATARTSDYASAEAVPIAQVGDWTWATSDRSDISDWRELIWANGPYLGMAYQYVTESEQTDWAALEEVALALNALFE